MKFSREQDENEGYGQRGKLYVRTILHIEPCFCIHCKNSVFERFYLKDYIEQRAVEIANYIITTNATVRQTAKKFGISKSTVHMVVTKKNCIEILYIWLNDKRERTINLDVYSFFFFRKILIVNIQNAMFI